MGGVFGIAQQPAYRLVSRFQSGVGLHEIGALAFSRHRNRAAHDQSLCPFAWIRRL
jgi:hypothetical protein